MWDRGRPSASVNKPVSEITSADLLHILAPIWHAEPETARRMRQRIGTAMKWAVAMEHRPDNPAGGGARPRRLARQQDGVQHPARARLRRGGPRRRQSSRASRGWAGTKLAFEFFGDAAPAGGERAAPHGVCRGASTSGCATSRSPSAKVDQRLATLDSTCPPRATEVGRWRAPTSLVVERLRGIVIEVLRTPTTGKRLGSQGMRSSR